MLALSGWDIGLEFHFLDPTEQPPASGLGPVLQAPFDDLDALNTLARNVDVLTYEFENLSAAALEQLTSGTTLRPNAQALAISQSRRAEKTYLQELGIPVAPWAPADDQQALQQVIEQLGLPAIAKLDRLGYDGKGQLRMQEPTDVEDAFAKLGGQPLVVEGMVPFEREVSIIGSRALDGELRCFPLTENEHRGGILFESRVSVEADPLQAQAESCFTKLANALDYVGTLTIEFFVVAGALVANEIAPRVHNSGHWTIEGAATSQFESHLRAVCGLPLGDTRALGPVAMRNFVGTIPTAETVLRVPGLRFHDYGKSPRPGRKLGHATVLASTEVELNLRLEALDAIQA